jgi:hopanoid biosynthesis associated protein HpnK
MVAAPAAADAVARARRTPSLKVGLHLVLTDGCAQSAPAQIPKLVDSAGMFRGSMVTAALRIALDPAVCVQLAFEIEAQFQAFARTGLKLDHVDCHKHFHLHPMIARLVIEIGRRYGMTALRVPFEPAELPGARPSGGITSRITRRCAAGLRGRVRREGLDTADRVFGLTWSGAMTEARLLALLADLPDGLTEIYFHPATSDVFPGAVPGYRYRAEYEALLSPEAKSILARRGIALAGFADDGTPSEQAVLI